MGTRKAKAEPKVELRLPADEARRVLWVAALEAEDPRGEVLNLELRRQATRDALQDADEAGWPGRRAERLFDDLRRSRPSWTRWVELQRLPTRWIVALLLVALVGGLATHALGPDSTINVLAPPLLGLLLWNLLTYVVLLVSALLPARPGKGLESGLENLMAKALGSRLPAESVADAGGDRVKRIWSRFQGEWLRAAAPMWGAQLRLTLHLAAVMAVVGVVLGMYARGLAFEYRASWQSTFLTADIVDRLLKTVLGPAWSMLAGDPVSAGEIRAPESTPAGPWIHAWALTALGVVGIPRLLLGAWQGWRWWRQSRRTRIQLSEAYLRRLKASVSLRQENVQVMLYSYQARERTLNLLRSLLLDLVGAKAQIRVMPTINYGQEPPEADGAGFRAVVFNAGQTPELEVHGELLEHLKQRRTDGQTLLIMIDESPFIQRLGDDSGQRLESRRRAWRRTLDHVDLPAAFVALDDAASLDTLLTRCSDGLWPNPDAASLDDGP